ncbi:fibronectin type III domain-containing protein [Flavobacterium sp. LS1R49]|uniref:Fibronectin type III domain-containing protein n=1 Tax=Flavobacterium shii TaxID=2987687 RepID=A0A9X2Z9Y9_9FLAO|nr:fibronectin type III domain-containing protein [Flavobacterium shii]MCV9926829.1 fibronectin type III domain-containing protein [Flavobacterium shii]
MLKKLKLQLFLTLGFLLLAFTGVAQTYPVTISTQLTQPSPIYLSNYADATTINSPIKVQLVLNDLSISNRQVRLKCYFQGNGVSFLTNDFVVGARALYLEGGFPLQLTNVDLAPYFQFQNIQGINPNQYAQALPEGIYTFSVEVYDFATGKKLSRKTSVTTIIFQNDPPFLNLPLNNASIMQQNIQNIIFSWTPRQINVSNVEYEFALVEIWDKYTPVQNAFAYSPPLYTTTTRATTLQYSLSEPQLIPGRRYAWRIKAKALANAEEVGVFKNNGYSEIYSFTYEVFCTAPLAIQTTGISQDQAKISWSGDIANYDYQVNYREKNANSEWYKLVTPREYATISNLKPNTTYEYTVGASCDLGKYTHSTIKEFTTMASDEIAFVGCGIKPDPKDLANKKPLPDLFPNDVVTAGDFPIVVLHSTGSNGKFTGDGYVTLPFLEKFRKLIDAVDALGGEKTDIGKFSRIRITFNNIGVNTDFKLISGEIIASYDATWSGVGDLDPLINDVFGDTGNIVQHDVQFVIDKVVKNPDGTITVTGTNGESFIQPKTANDIIFTDKDGKQYAVPPNATTGDIPQTGQLAPGGIPTSKNTNGMGSGGDVAQISSEDVTIEFSKGNGFYGFDVAPAADNGTLSKTYETIPKKNGNPYKVNYKAISDSPNSTDIVTATATFKNGKTASDIVFKTQNGTEIKSTWSGNTATIELKRTLDFAKETIIATVKPTAPKDPKDPKAVAGNYDIAGTMNMWHLTQKSINLKVISINNASITNVESDLNAIYNKAGVKFNVATQNVNLPASYYPKNTIECGDSGWLAQYTAEQQAIIAYIKTQITYEKDSYYVLVTNIPSSKGLAGFMPLKRQFGFIFSKATDKDEDKGSTVKVIAHELGHGVFGLQHPFTEYKTTTPTDLLMDYGTGAEFSHNDWQVLHASGLQLYLFQGDEAGEHVEVGNMEQLYTNFKNNDGSLTFLTPAGKPFTIKEPISSVGFSYFDDNWSTDKSNFENTVFPIGTLKKFTLTNGKTYSIAHPVKDDNQIDIVGYAELDKNGQAIQNTLYIDKISFGLKDKNIIVGIPAIEKGQLLFKVQKINNYANLDVPKDNYGSGPQKSVYFLDTYIKEFKQGINISSSISPLDINELYFISEFSSDLYGMNALHAIRIAYFLRNNPDLINCLGYAQDQVGKDVTLRFNKEMRDGLRASLSKNQGTTRVSITAFYADISNDVKKDIFTSTKYLASLDAILHTYYNELKNKGNVSTDLSLSDLSEVIDGLGRECLLSNIPIEKRIEFLKQYKTWKISGSKEDMLLELLINIRPDDISKLLTKLSEDNYELLRGLYNDMNSKDDYYTLLSVISAYVTEQKKNSAEAIGLQGTWKAGAEKYVYVCKDAMHILTCGVEITELNEANGKVIIKFQDFSNTFNNKPVFKTVEVNPFDLIRIKFENDFDIKNTNGKEIKEGQEAIVPAIYLYWIMKQQQDKTTAIQLRIALDILAIIPAVVSANPELVVLVDAAVASTDIAFQLSSDAIKTSDNKKLNAFVDLWDQVYVTYSLGRLSSSVLSGGNGAAKIIFNKENLNKTIARAKAIPGELGNISQSFYKLYKAIKNSENITVVTTKKQILENTIYGSYIEITLAEKCTILDEFKLLFQNDKIIVGVNAKMTNGANYAQGVSIASITETNGALILSDLRTLPATYAGTTKVVETIKNITIAGKGAQTIEVITTDVGQFYARQLITSTENVNFLASVEKNYPTIFNKIKNDTSLKNKFETDFKNTNTSVLTEIEDIAHFEDDYNSFVTLWKSASSTELANVIKDLDKFKAWWYPQKIKVVDELFTNQKAFEGTLNNRFTNIEKIPSSVRGEVWNYYKQQKWDKLESLFKEYKINLQVVQIDPKTKIEIIWPPANGGFNKSIVSLSKGKHDRYGAVYKIENGVPILTGTFTSPMENGNSYSFSQRALNLTENKYDVYYEIEILKPLPFQGEKTTIIPWFKELGGVGGGQQIMWRTDKDVDGYSKSMTKLSEEGFIKITIKSSPNNKYPELVNKTIINGKLSGDHPIFNKLNTIGNDVNELNSWINQTGIPEKLLNKLETLSISELKTLSSDIKETTSLQNLLKTNPENGLEAWKIYRENLPTTILCK